MTKRIAPYLLLLALVGAACSTAVPTTTAQAVTTTKAPPATTTVPPTTTVPATTTTTSTTLAAALWDRPDASAAGYAVYGSPDQLITIELPEQYRELDFFADDGYQNFSGAEYDTFVERGLNVIIDQTDLGAFYLFAFDLTDPNGFSHNINAVRFDVVVFDEQEIVGNFDGSGITISSSEVFETDRSVLIQGTQVIDDVLTYQYILVYVGSQDTWVVTKTDNNSDVAVGEANARVAFATFQAFADVSAFAGPPLGGISEAAPCADFTSKGFSAASCDEGHNAELAAILTPTDAELNNGFATDSLSYRALCLDSVANLVGRDPSQPGFGYGWETDGELGDSAGGHLYCFASEDISDAFFGSFSDDSFDDVIAPYVVAGDLAPGECFFFGEVGYALVELADCSQAGAYVAVGSFQAADSATYPGEELLRAERDTRCVIVAAESGVGIVDGSLSGTFPGESQWLVAGMRTVVCDASPQP